MFKVGDAVVITKSNEYTPEFVGKKVYVDRIVKEWYEYKPHYYFSVSRKLNSQIDTSFNHDIDCTPDRWVYENEIRKAKH